MHRLVNLYAKKGGRESKKSITVHGLKKLQLSYWLMPLHVYNSLRHVTV